MSNKTNVRIAIAGAAGRMGQRLCALCAETTGLELTEAFEIPGHRLISHPAAENPNVLITDTFQPNADALIDFTVPALTRQLLKDCASNNVAMVIGTTGLTDEDNKAIDDAAKSIPIVQAPNMSLGMNLMFALSGQIAKQLGDDYDIEILEAHHRYKKDAPSGTALGIANSICDATGKTLKDDVVMTRAGDNDPRETGKITMQTLRMGDTVGQHTVFYAGLGERIELAHVATTRDTFARGALKAALWLNGKPAGRYNMADVLGLKD